MLPSSCWWFSSSAISARETATPVPFSVCTSSLRLLGLPLEADPQAAGLVIRAVRAARHLAPIAALSAPRQPGLEVEFAIGGRAEIARGDVDHAVGNLERLEDRFLESQDLGVQGLRVLGARDHEHLHLRELVHAVEPAALASGRARLGAEAVRDAGEAERKRSLLEDLVGVQAAQRDLGRSDQVEIHPRNRIDLRLGAARAEGEAVDDGLARQIGRREGRVAATHHGVEREALERQVEQHRLVLQEVELLPGDLRPRLEVDQRELLPERDVIERIEGEPARRTHAAQLAEVGLAAGGRLRVNEVRDRFEGGLQRALGLRHRRLQAGDLVLEPPPLGRVRLAGGARELALARGLVLVAQAIRLAKLCLGRGEPFLGADRAVDVRRDAAAPAALDDLVASLGEAAGIEHAGTGKHSAACRAKRARLDPASGGVLNRSAFRDLGRGGRAVEGGGLENR